MQKHEKNCVEIISIDESSDSDNASIDDLQIIEHIKPSEVSISKKNDLMNYLGLNVKMEDNVSTMDDCDRSNIESHSKRQMIDVRKCLKGIRKIEFSSLLGTKVLEKHIKNNTRDKFERNISCYEYYCCYPKLKGSREFKKTDFKVSYKEKDKEKIWNHVYSYGRNQRRERYLTLKSGQ